MSSFYSPLRYPGGKNFLRSYLSEVITLNQPIDTYVEPFAGGAALALTLLFNKSVKNIILNDADNFIYKFWYSVLYLTEDLIEKIESTPININEWRKQKDLFKNKEKQKSSIDLDIGFAAFYLNRCNRSGIMSAGPIGGHNQKGKWKLDCRFNKANLIKRIEAIAERKESIKILNYDAIELLRYCINNKILNFNNTIVYLDPPYYKHGPELYTEFYDYSDHENLMKFLKKDLQIKWLLSYDDVPTIRELYKGSKQNGYSVNHFAYKAKIGKELIIASDQCKIPRNIPTNKN